MSNMNFLIADVISFVFGTIKTFSQENATKIKFKQFSEHGSWTTIQVIPGNAQNTIPTNQGATGSKLDQTS